MDKLVLKEQEVDYSKAVNMMLRHSKLVAEDSLYSFEHIAIENIAKWYVQCDQAQVPEEGFIDCLRVVRIRKGIPKFAINSMRCKKNDGDAEEFARTVFGGMYMVVHCAHLSKSLLEKSIQGHGKLWYYSLPKEVKSVYDEKTLRMNTDGTALVLAKSDLTDWITSGSHYQMLEVNDI